MTTTPPIEEPAEHPFIGFSVDDLVQAASWAEHADALGRWKQGHLLRDVPLTWIAPQGIDPVLGFDFAEDAAGPAWPAGVFDAIVCSQTCDIGAGPPGDKHPTVLVAPLVHENGLSSGSRRTLAASGKLGYLVQVLPASEVARRKLFGPANGSADDSNSEGQASSREPARMADVRRTPRGQRWYADLRLLVAVSKALLAAREPVEAFVQEAESLAFGEILAQKFRRAALHEALSEALPELLEEFIRNAGATQQCFAKVEQVRLHILEGDRLNPGRAQLVVLTGNGVLSDAEQDQWSGLNKGAAQLFGQHDISYAPVVHYDVNEMRATVYRATVPVRCPLLGHTRWP